MFKLILYLGLLTVVSCEKFRFDNYALFKVVPESEEQLESLQQLQENDLGYDFWTEPVPNAPFVSIMANPLKKNQLEHWLNFNGIRYEITMHNIQEAIDKEKIQTYSRNNIRNMTWNAYYPLEDIEAWMSDIAAGYPDIVTEVVGGISFEGRDIKGLKISHGPGRKVIFVESGIHSREWIAMTSACYIINELVTSNDSWTQAAARDYDWYIFPVTNPDGYVWTHTNFRMWRKNRRPIGQFFGVDLNRNWNSNWLVAGSSTNPAADNFAGPGPFSEPETRTLSTYLRNIGDIEMYLSIHSFSQLLLLPFGNSTGHYDNYYDAVNIGRRAMGALSVRYGTVYTTGNIAATIYNATGGSIDWVKETLGVPLVYCYELRDRGQHGFILPTEQILPNNQEVMDSVLELIHQAKRFGYMNGSSGLQISFILMISALLSLIWH